MQVVEKSELIQALHPSSDLEHLANHLGSSFGEHQKVRNLVKKPLKIVYAKFLCKID